MTRQKFTVVSGTRMERGGFLGKWPLNADLRVTSQGVPWISGALGRTSGDSLAHFSYIALTWQKPALLDPTLHPPYTPICTTEPWPQKTVPPPCWLASRKVTPGISGWRVGARGSLHASVMPRLRGRSVSCSEMASPQQQLSCFPLSSLSFLFPGVTEELPTTPRFQRLCTY